MRARVYRGIHVSNFQMLFRHHGFRHPLLTRIIRRPVTVSIRTQKLILSSAIAGSATGLLAYNETGQRIVLIATRSFRVASAVIFGIYDYKITLGEQTYSADELSECHRRSARRVLQALMANGGVFIKLGQHMSSLAVLPSEWTTTLRPLQDQCNASSMTDITNLILEETGDCLPNLFSTFDVIPLGVASLAQVHRATYNGVDVAVKVQHPHIRAFSELDMQLVEQSLKWVRYFFPNFEFDWLAEEMRENLPRELNFDIEASNSMKAAANFENVNTSLRIPEVLWVSKRLMIMEYIEGGRVDDLKYLASHNIDRNAVSLELQRIFSRMIHLQGFFHADPHPGNLLIRPSPSSSRSPYNFEVVLLDHGLYFDLDEELRINYSRLWLSFLDSASPQSKKERRKYAELVANIGPDLYPVFEAAITGSPNLDKALEGDVSGGGIESIREAVINQEGLLESVFELLRRVPRRMLMVLKLNDLTRNLDGQLGTTHSAIRIYLITARYCCMAVWLHERSRLKAHRQLFSIKQYVSEWWRFEWKYRTLQAVELYLDATASFAQRIAWIRGLLLTRGFAGAHDAAAGLI